MENEDADISDELELDREISVTHLLSSSQFLRGPRPPGKVMNHEWPIEKVRFNESNPRRRLRDASFNELVDSIRAQGILSPLLITPDGTVLAGNRRLAAAHEVKLTTVPVRVLNHGAKDRALVPLIENLVRCDLTPLDAMEYMVTLREKWKLNAPGISKLTGISPGTINNYLRIADGPKAIKQMIAEDRIGMSAACALLRHADSELVNLLSKKEQVSYKEAQQLIATIKSEKAKEPIIEPIVNRPRNEVTASGFLFYSGMVVKFLESDLCDLTHEQIFGRLKDMHGMIGALLAKANEPRKPVKISVNRSEHPAIVAFKAATGTYPKRALMDHVIETLGEAPDSVRLNDVFVAWTKRGYNPMNLAWLDWYINGVPDRNSNGNGNKNGKSYQTASQRNVGNIRDSLSYIADLPADSRQADT